MLAAVKQDTRHKESCHFDRWTLQGLVVAICTTFYLLPTQCIYMCGSQDKQQLFPHTALTGFYNREGVCSLRDNN